MDLTNPPSHTYAGTEREREIDGETKTQFFARTHKTNNQTPAVPASGESSKNGPLSLVKKTKVFS